jgi:hypothetical protein
MLAFDPQDPFPLLAEDRHSYAEAQAHAALVDTWLGFDMEAIELTIAGDRSKNGSDGQESWVGLAIKSLLTPYTELRQIIERLQPRAGEAMIDLGAAYGRLGFVVAKHAPGVSFKGYELVAERAREGNRCLENFAPHALIQLETADLRSLEFKLPKAEYYFMYDFGSREAIDKILAELGALARIQPVTVVGRGGRTRDAIERHNPWLSQVHMPEHHPHYSIYVSAGRQS